jgi:hypothetical protein
MSKQQENQLPRTFDVNQIPSTKQREKFLKESASRLATDVRLAAQREFAHIENTVGRDKVRVHLEKAQNTTPNPAFPSPYVHRSLLREETVLPSRERWLNMPIECNYTFANALTGSPLDPFFYPAPPSDALRFAQAFPGENCLELAAQTFSDDDSLLPPPLGDDSNDGGFVHKITSAHLSPADNIADLRTVQPQNFRIAVDVFWNGSTTIETIQDPTRFGYGLVLLYADLCVTHAENANNPTVIREPLFWQGVQPSNPPDALGQKQMSGSVTLSHAVTATSYWFQVSLAVHLLLITSPESNLRVTGNFSSYRGFTSSGGRISVPFFMEAFCARQATPWR